MKNSETDEDFSRSEIAIIGMAGRFPGAQSIDAFWENLRSGVESITFFTDEQLLASGVDPEALNSPRYVKARSVLEDVELFDAAFFGLNPREAEYMDPQHRLFLECVWEVIENAGYDPVSYKGAIGLYAGASMNSYLLHNLCANPGATALPGAFQGSLHNHPASLATGIAYRLNLRGPCYTVMTFCSTSLVAVHMACQSLLNFECDMAIAGGVSVSVPQNAGYWYQEGLIVSPDGHCRPFDAKANGTVFGNGLGAVALKRLEDALADGDHIDALILGSATNNDGSLKVSYTAPSVAGQAEVVVEALASAGLEPEMITYVETHGTGTALGDPTEITALTQAFRSGTQDEGFCAIGSVKSNVGHLDVAAGVAGLIKTILALKHKQIPPSLHFETPNPHIDFENSPFFVNTDLSEWKADSIPRQAGVSSFGVGGTNAHVIMQEAPEIDLSSPSRRYQLLLLSAKTSSALNKMSENLVQHLKQHPNLNLADVAYTLQVGRRSFSHRRMIICEHVDEAVSLLESADAKKVLTSYQEQQNPPVVFMFSGQGSQYVNMGLELYETESEFREGIDRCSEVLQPDLGLDLRNILYPLEENIEEATENLNQTSLTQPALFVIEYALAKLWMSWGVQPAAMVGHSIGEYVAACLAEVFSLEDALSLVAARGWLMQELPTGSMLAVPLSEKEIQPFLGQDLSLAVINAPSFCVVSGEKEPVEDFEKELSKKNVNCRHLHTSHAFHSPMMDPILDTFAERVKRVAMHPPQIPFLSNVTGTWISPEEAMNPNYWARHLRQTIRFSNCVGELLEEPNRVFLEVGPGRTLTTLARQHTPAASGRVMIPSIRHPQEQLSDTAFILNTFGRLWLAGIEVDWSGFYRNEKRHRVALPTYPFERKRYWIEPEEQPRGFLAARIGLINKGKHSSQPVTSSQVNVDIAISQDPGFQSDYVAPRNEVEQKIAYIWHRLFGIKQVGIHDNYFDLGGDSLLASQLFAQIENMFHKRIPLAALFEAPTVEQLARMLEKEDWSAPWSPLVAIQSGGSKPPFFCIHGAGGNVLIYRDLAHHLGPDQPVYGLQSQGLDGKQPFLARVEDMASRYVREIQTVQPEGPYLLGGYCLGGTIALEIAQQLYATGQEVALLVFLETYNWANLGDKSFLEDVYFHLQKIDFHWRNFMLLKPKEKLTFIKEKAKVARQRSKVWFGMITSRICSKLRLGTGQYSYLFDLWEVNDRAALSYLPKAYPGQITQFLPIKEYTHHVARELGWDKLAAGGLKTYQLPVYPAGMLVEPFVRISAEKLRACIDDALEKK